ncbi:MAG: hypothetical protein A3H96_20640 [Acidobacteria bacterium RIFCSPLOWO2_02_FULL_67_36]|nr:MAG: hypothetical protein A3H96_20640 [Acidobacteria bacterium RIFCSPLOWO2_02_FULL_67_36]
MHPILLLIAAALLTGPPQQATSQPSMVSNPDGSARTAAPADEDLPVSLDRIRRALARPPALDLRGKPVFRVEVFGRKPTIEDILGPDFLKGPVPYGGMTHQEFLNMVTPKDVQGYAAFTNKEGMTVAATSLALQWALQKAIHKFEQARNEREKEAARKEVQDALADLAKARLKAGLPPK